MGHVLFVCPGLVTVTRLGTARGELYTASTDSTLKVWDLKTGQLKREILLASGALCGAAVANYILIGCRNGSVEVYTADKGQRILEVKCFPANVTCLQYDEDSEKLIVGSAFGVIKIFHMSNSVETTSIQCTRKAFPSSPASPSNARRRTQYAYSRQPFL